MVCMRLDSTWQERERESSNLFVRHIKKKEHKTYESKEHSLTSNLRKSSISLYNCRDGRLRQAFKKKNELTSYQKEQIGYIINILKY